MAAWCGAIVVSVLRVAPATAVVPRLNYDSLGFLASPQLAGARPPLVPLLYALLGHQLRTIVIVQSAVGALCWAVLAFAARRFAGYRLAGWLAFVGVLVVSLTDMVTHWDVCILSDSVSLSLLALLLAAGLTLAETRSPRRIAAFLTLAVLWGLTRDTNAYLLGLLGLAGMLLVLLARRPRWVLLPAMFVLVAVGVAGSANQGRRWVEPFLHLTSERILTDRSRTQWFADHGMPVTPALLDLRGPYLPTYEHTYLTSPALASFRQWADRHGQEAYMAYVVTHPAWSLIRPFGRHEELSSALLGYYGSLPYEPWWPVPLRHLLLVDAREAMVAEAIGLGLVVGWVFARGARPSKVWAIPGVVVVAGLCHLVVAWLGDTWEVGRHSVDAMVQVQVGLLLCLAVAVAAPGLERNGRGHRVAAGRRVSGGDDDPPDQPPDPPQPVAVGAATVTVPPTMA
jgi:hypothetical protein